MFALLGKPGYENPDRRAGSKAEVTFPLLISAARRKYRRRTNL